MFIKSTDHNALHNAIIAFEQPCDKSLIPFSQLSCDSPTTSIAKSKTLVSHVNVLGMETEKLSYYQIPENLKRQRVSVKHCALRSNCLIFTGLWWASIYYPYTLHFLINSEVYLLKATFLWVLISSHFSLKWQCRITAQSEIFIAKEVVILGWIKDFRLRAPFLPLS